MKKFNLLLLAMMAFGLTCFTACSDDDDNNGNSTEIPEGSNDEGSDVEASGDEVDEPMDDNGDEAVEDLTGDKLQLALQQQAVANILRILADVQKVELPLQQYEPVYGVVLDESKPYTRTVFCPSVGQAEAAFQAIVGNVELLKTTADGFSISLRDIPLAEDGTKVTLGTMAFHRGDGMREMGSIDVHIACIPHLIRIEFLPPEAMPDNGSADSPYLVGDLIWLPKGNSKGYCSGYYVCVRQSVSGSGGLLVHMCEGEPGGDETINQDGDHQGCWFPYNKSKGMPTESGHVEAYISFLMTEKTYVDNLKFYLNGKIHDRQPQPGKVGHIFPGGFNNDNGYVYKSSNSKGARIFYNSDYTDENYYWIFGGTYRRSWYWWVTNNCTSNTDWSQYITSHTADYYKDNWWNDFISNCNPFTMNVITFRNNTIPGAILEYSPSTQNVTFENDAKFVTQSHLGWVYTSNNRLYETVKKARAAGQEPIGIVVYVNDGSDFGNRVTEKDGENYGHGLVLALSNCAGDPAMRWNPGSGSIAPIDYEFTQYVNKETGAKTALTDFGGLEKTMALNMAGSEAAHKALNFQVEAPKPFATSWFLPSAAQWLAILCKPGLGGMPMPSNSDAFPTYMESGTKQAFANINQHLTGSGVYTFGGSTYWSSSAYSDKIGIYVTGNNGGTRLTYWNASKKAHVRPIFAF